MTKHSSINREPIWLSWARAIQALAQTGLTYTENPFDADRYRQLLTVAAEMMAAGSEVTLERVEDLFADQAGTMTPKIDVRGAVFLNGTILLVRERLDDSRWTLPGGWADVNESPSQAVVREIREESGYETRATKLLALYDRDLHDHPPHAFHIYKVFFQCELIGGAPASSTETEGAAFFSEDKIPDNLSTGRVTQAQLYRLFEHYRHPDWPADFD